MRKHHAKEYAESEKNNTENEISKTNEKLWKFTMILALPIRPKAWRKMQRATFRYTKKRPRKGNRRLGYKDMQ